MEGEGNYTRLWPTRGDQLFDATVSYLISVFLIAFAGVSFVIVTVCTTCVYGCTFLRCCQRCRKCCEAKDSENDVKRKRFVVFVLVAIALATAALLTALVGSTRMSQALAPLSGGFSVISRIFFGGTEVLARFLETYMRVQQAMLDANITVPFQPPNLEPVYNWTTSAQDTACLAQRVAVFGVLVTVIIVILGQGAAFASVLIVIVGIVQGRRNLVSVGTLLLVGSMVLTGLLIAICTPLSVYLDDLCWTLHESSTAEPLFGCTSENLQALYEITGALVNFTGNFANGDVNAICIAFNAQTAPLIGGASFSPIPLYVPFFSNLSTVSELSLVAMDYSVPPFLDMLTSSQHVIIEAANATNFSLSLDPAYLASVYSGIMLQTCSRLLGRFAALSNCSSELQDDVRLFVLTSCNNVKSSIGMIVWGTAVAALLFFVVFTVYAVFQRLLPSAPVNPRRRCCLSSADMVLIVMAQSFAAALVGLISMHDELQVVGNLSLWAVYACIVGLSALCFVAAVIPPQLFSGCWRARRLIFLVCLLFGLCFGAMCAYLAAKGASIVRDCVERSCSIGLCPLPFLSGALINTIVNIVVCGCSLAVAVYGGLVAGTNRCAEQRPFTGVLDEDFVLQEVTLVH